MYPHVHAEPAIMRGTGGGERENEVFHRRLQLSGILLKKPLGQSRNWAKRFFIIKDGFLIYYAESERKDFDKRKSFNIHPKGVVPLGGCIIEPSSDNGQAFGISIRSDEVEGHFQLACDSDYEREKWVNMLQESSRITWRNAQLGDAMIRQLEVQGLQMAEEKQVYFDKLQNEVSARHDEKERTEELERLNEELEKEKSKMTSFTESLQKEYESLKGEMDETVSSLRNIEQEKVSLHDHTSKLQASLEDLEKQKQQTLATLEKHQSETTKLSEEKQNLQETTSSLQESLQKIELLTQQLESEKMEAENKLQQKAEKAVQLECEKKYLTEHASDLKTSIKDLEEQKSVTETQLKEEILARMEAENRLKEAEASLKRLEIAVDGTPQEGRNEEELKEEMSQDVRTLKKFFENLAFEAKLDAEKPIMIKNAIHARKVKVRRAKTMRLEQNRYNRRLKAPRTGSYETLQSIFDERLQPGKEKTS